MSAKQELDRLLWRMGEPAALDPEAARRAVLGALGGMTEEHPAWLAFNWVMNNTLAMERAAAAADATRYPRAVAVEEMQYALAQLWQEAHGNGVK